MDGFKSRLRLLLMTLRSFVFHSSRYFGNRVCMVVFSIQNLREVLAEKIPEKQDEVKEFRKKYGSHVVGEIQVDMVS